MALVDEIGEHEPTDSQGRLSEDYWTLERLDLYRWLSLRAPEVANTYAGALFIMESDYPIPGREHFVAHAAREIWNRLVELVLGPDGSPGAADRFDRIVTKWRFAEEYTSCDNGVNVPCSVFKTVDRNVREYNSRETPRQKNIQMLREMIGSSVPEEELKLEAKNLSDTSREFVRAAHLSINERVVDWQELVDAFGYIERVVRATARPSTSIRREIDELLDEANN